jgi:hypothetical protein
MLDVDVSDKGTGITFTPATRFAHKSGDAVQALGSGITLDKALDRNHGAGTALINTRVTSDTYQGSVKPDQWFGAPLSTTAGSLALTDAGGVMVDAVVYGSQQSNSSANGTITSPEIAVLEGNQGQGGCIVVVPDQGRNYGIFAPATGIPNKSLGRFPDGADTDSNCSDFLLQNTTTLSARAVAGSNNIKVASVADFNTGQNIIIGYGPDSETVNITTVGTAGATTISSFSSTGATTLAVISAAGFTAGQTITIDKGADYETATVGSVFVARRRFGIPGSTPVDSIKITTPLKYAHVAGAQVSGSGITLDSPLTKVHDIGEQVAGNIPTPGEPNKYNRKTQ